MKSQTISTSRRVATKTRRSWAREGGARRRYSWARARRALRARLRCGWVPVIPDGRSPNDRVAVLWRTHSLAKVARAYLSGQRWFRRDVLESALGRVLNSREGARALAAAGFALAAKKDDMVALRAADPRVAALVNRARIGPQRRGYRIRRVVEAVLSLPSKVNRRHRVTEERRLEVARILQDEWDIDGDDVLNCRPFARLGSHWTL